MKLCARRTNAKIMKARGIIEGRGMALVGATGTMDLFMRASGKKVLDMV